MAKKTGNPVGRPTAMTPEAVETICKRLSGGESLRQICLSDNSLPDISTVFRAVVQDRDGFYDKYVQAREAAGFAHADRINEVVELLSEGALDPNVAKAMMDGLKWTAERMSPKHHSPRQNLDHTSGGEKIKSFSEMYGTPKTEPESD